MSRYNRFSSASREPLFLLARFQSVCPETGKTIKKGDECAYFPAERKAYHSSSKTASDLRAVQFAKSWNMADAEW